jgi:hypothetical protein
MKRAAPERAAKDRPAPLRISTKKNGPSGLYQAKRLTIFLAIQRKSPFKAHMEPGP